MGGLQNFVDPAATTVTITDGGGSITVDGTITSYPLAGTPTQTAVTASNSSVTLISANANRKHLTIWNDGTSTRVLYIRLNATAATTANATIKLFPQGVWEMPFLYTGEIRGIWTGSGTTSARITEYV